MPIPSPFHERTSQLCTSYRWKDWAGYAAVCSYDTTHDREYFAFRESAGLLDVSPLFKYEVHGPDAAALLSRMMVRDVSKLKVGRVGYSCWCDDYGKVIDDGTVTRLEEDYYRVTAADPTLHWLQAVGRGMRVTLEDSSARLATLALQGPRSRDILRAASTADMDKLKFFGATRAKVDGLDAWITRTGYTGDLGYEVWVERDGAL
ncbi:MAG TPA: aminomethyl transferase family protein, partial [Thermoanaerobaculia bacterium]|nr:aminomethyl transferase family protein [Thermoanaerobaculia bacterium]